MWKQFVLGLCPEAEFAESKSAHRLDEVESLLGVRFPEELRTLLRETDGILGEYGLGLIWPLDRILADNLKFRKFRESAELASHYMPFDHLLFFADAGNGDQFAFAIRADGVIGCSDVFVWDHEDDSRRCIATSLRRYLEGWLTGELKI